MMDVGNALGVLMVDASTRDRYIVAANEAIQRYLGYRPGELIGMRLNEVIPERSRAVHDEHVDAYMTEPPDPETRAMGPDREVYILHRDGTETRVWIGLDPQPNGVHVTAAIIDVENFRGHSPLNPKPDADSAATGDAGRVSSTPAPEGT